MNIRILLLLLCARFSIAAKVLGIFPSVGKSNFIYNEAIVKALWSVDHHIIMISSFPQKNALENFTDIDMSKLHPIMNNNMPIQFVRTSSRGLNIVSKFIANEKLRCKNILDLKEIQDILHSDQKLIDVIITEIQFVHCYLPLAKKVNVPIIGTMMFMSLSGADELIANPNNPSYVPQLFSDVGTRMDFKERLHNTVYRIKLKIKEFLVVNPVIDGIYDDYFPGLKQSRDEIEHEVSVIFYNNHPAFFSRPNVPNGIDIGGVHISNVKPLPYKIEDFINRSEHGVILFSLGSVVRSSTFDPLALMAFKKVFAKLPQHVIWKFDNEEESVSGNVMVLDWVPQRDVLAHEKVILFVSHCGLSGTFEAISSGTPMIGIPLFADQESNARILEEHGVAVRLEYEKLTEETIFHAIDTVINDTKYMENMKRLSLAFNDRPVSPQELVVYWTEYVIRHNGAAHLRSSAINLTWYQYYLVDVIVLMLILLLALILLISYATKLLIYSVKGCVCKLCSKKKVE